MNKKAAEREQRIFRSFAEQGPLRIDLASIQSPPPPAPDILCSVANIGLVAFELVELIDPDYARRVSEMAKTTEMFRTLPQRLPASVREGITRRLGAPYIAIDFTEKAPLRDREGAAVAALEWLLARDVIGEHNVVEGSLSDKVAEVHVHTEWKLGLKFETGSFGWVADPTMERLESKFGKKYASDHPIELLMYTEVDLLLPDDVWQPTIEPFVQEKLSESPFRRVWLFKAGAKTIDYVYPPL